MWKMGKKTVKKIFIMRSLASIIAIVLFICFPEMGFVRFSYGLACDASPCRSGIANDACCRAIAQSVEKGMCSCFCRSLNGWGYSSLPSKCAATDRCKSCSLCICTTRDFEFPFNEDELWNTRFVPSQVIQYIFTVIPMFSMILKKICLAAHFCWARVWEFRFGFSKISVAEIVWNEGFSELTRFDRTTCCNLIGIPQNWTFLRVPQEWTLWPFSNLFGSSEKKRLVPLYQFFLCFLSFIRGDVVCVRLKAYPNYSTAYWFGSDVRVSIFVWASLLNFMAIFLFFI